MPPLKMRIQSLSALSAFLLGILLSGTAFAEEAGGQAAETRPAVRFETPLVISGRIDDRGAGDDTGPIVELPNPVRLAVIPHSFIGPDAEGKPAMVDVVLFQSAGGLCLVQINPADGTSRQWWADDEAINSYGYEISGDGRIHIGTSTPRRRCWPDMVCARRWR